MIMEEDARVNLKIWIPIIIGLLAIVGSAIALGRKDAKLDTLAEDVRDVKTIRIELEVLKSGFKNMEKKQDKMDEKLDAILKEVKK